MVNVLCRWRGATSLRHYWWLERYDLRMLVISLSGIDELLGIVYANLAIINPKAAYNFFTQSDFDMSWIDGGASRTWYIAMSAMLGGAS